MRTFNVMRDADISGVSGTGRVAEAVEFDNGKVVLAWLGNSGVASVAVYDSLEEVNRVHGHEGATFLVEVHQPDIPSWITEHPAMDPSRLESLVTMLDWADEVVVGGGKVLGYIGPSVQKRDGWQAEIHGLANVIREARRMAREKGRAQI